ncbi:DUF6449 domain-containing protein [Lacrimispora amygdalina]|uniref:DUF6449 domain-containing protein n=1 Tax=Lacrimispora amygdalina TaxID=253257 RepID=UPI000BE2A318|nr:DUF6449 domain-containing protein [Lacrimispora amygdalina]
MTSRNLFFNIIKEDIKRRLWAVTLTFLLFFFSLPVSVAMILGDFIKEEQKKAYVISELQHFLGFQNGWMVFVIMVLSVIMGVTSFSYLHSRQKIDFYHGIPVNRKHLFWANYTNGILIVTAAYGINIVLSLGVAAAYGILPAKIIGTVLSGFLFFLLHYAMIYAVTVLAMIMTGSVIVGIFGTAVFEGYFTALLLVLQGCYGYFFHTSYKSGEELFLPFLKNSSPYAIFISNVAANRVTVSQILIVVVLFILFTFLCLLLYKKRGSETAKKAMAFKISKPLIRIPIVVLSALFGSFFFYMIRSYTGWAVFGLLCGMFLSHCVIEIIYHFDFRKLFSNWKQMIASALVAALVFAGFQLDLFGYDSYIPQESSIESMAVSLRDNNNWVSYGDAVQDGLGDYHWEYESADDYIFNHMKLKDNKAAYSIIKKAVENNSRRDWEGAGSSTWRQGAVHDLSVKYTLKNGKDVYRSYSIDESEIREELTQLYQDPVFIQAVYPVFSQTAENTAAVRVSRGSQSSIVSRDRNGTDKAMTEKLLLAYQKDFGQLTVETMTKENPVASIQFMTRMQAEADSRREGNQNSWQYSDVTSRGYYPVYPSFSNTMELLKECQLNVDNWTSIGEIHEISIDLNSYYYDKPVYDTNSARYYKITDPQMITQIMSESAIEEYAGMNPFGIWNTERVSFTVSRSAGNGLEEAQYTVPVDRLPDSVKEVLKQ